MYIKTIADYQHLPNSLVLHAKSIQTCMKLLAVSLHQFSFSSHKHLNLSKSQGKRVRWASIRSSLLLDNFLE